MNRLRFEHLETNYVSNDKVLITVTMDTKNRDSSFEIVKGAIIEAIENTQRSNISKTAFQIEQLNGISNKSDFLEEL